jgi:hypothetical protein
VLSTDRGQPVASVLLGVLGSAWSEEAEVDQAHSGGDNAGIAWSARVEVPFDRFADGRKPRPERQRPVVFLPVPPPPLGVIQVLSAPGRICPGLLDVTGRIGADPDVSPCGREARALILFLAAVSRSGFPSCQKYLNPRPLRAQPMPGASRSLVTSGNHWPARHSPRARSRHNRPIRERRHVDRARCPGATPGVSLPCTDQLNLCERLAVLGSTADDCQVTASQL